MNNGLVIQGCVLEEYQHHDTCIEIPDHVKVIGKEAFKGCAFLEEIMLPESITSIMEGAFKGCRKLKKVNFPSKLTHVGEYAFHRCHSLQCALLPDTVKSLGNCAFLYCDSLEYVSIPGVIHLGRQVFLNDINLKRLEIAEDLDISCICDVFTGCSKITSIRLSGGTVCNIDSLIDASASHSHVHPLVKAIAADVFRMMDIREGTLIKFLTNLRNLEIPSGITEIAKSCFYDKKGLVSVKLPETLKRIGSRSFRNCINLERVAFANENVEISPDAFKNCTTLKYITLHDGSTYELKGLPDSSRENIPQMIKVIHSQILNNFFISGTTLVQYRGCEERVVVPEGITTIGERAFAKNGAVGRVILPNSVREIHEEAFADCLLLQTINLPEGLEYIGKSTFENCVKLIRIKLPDSMTMIEKSSFNRCKKLNEVQFGSKIKEIGDFAFYGCNSLKHLQLPESLLRIGDMAFYKCLSLKEITLPNSLRKLGNNVFTGAGVQTATIRSNLNECGTDIFSQCSKLWKLTFDEGIKSVGDKFAFQCTALRQVQLPSTIEHIGRNAFDGSMFEQEMIYPVIAERIFFSGKGLTGDIVIPDGITSIAGGAFYGNTNITSVAFPNSLFRIGSRAFCGCTSLKGITLPEGVIELEEGVFAYCTSLEYVISKGKITHLSDNAFYGCSSLLQVPAEEAVAIGKNALSGCTKLDNLEICCNDFQADALRNTAYLETLRKHTPLVIVANAVVDGKCCMEDVIIPEGVTCISPYAFAGNGNIRRVFFPESLTKIGEGAFSGCKHLENIQLPSMTEIIGRKAFEKCVSLTFVSGNARVIGEEAFSYCIGLQNVELQGTHTFKNEAFYGCAVLKKCRCNQLQEIGESCFHGCSSLEDFDFSNIQSIGSYGFYGCNSLKSISLKEETWIDAHAFEDCCGLEELVLPDGVLRYGSYAFSGCTALKVVFLGDRKYMTEKYSMLVQKDVPDLVKSIYNSAISCFRVDENLTLFEYTNQGCSVHIPEGIQRIEREVFKDAVNLEELYVPKSVKYIGERAFHGTRWLEKLRNLTPMVVVNNILLDASLCQGDVTIPADIGVVSGWAFANCNALTGIALSSPKTKTEQYAFRNCINLKKVLTADGSEYKLRGIADRTDEQLPLRVKQIFMDCLNCFKTDENNVLIECTGNIGNLMLVNGITAIGDLVFKDSNLLTHITMTKDVVSIGKSAFELCKWLVSVRNARNVIRVEKLAFSGCALLEIIELSEKLEYIGVRAFEQCSSLKCIVIPEGITEIPEKAFYRCTSLETVALPSTLKTIGKEAFAFNYKLKEINFPEGLAMIDSRAFAWCSQLNGIKLPEGTSKKPDSFSFCSL